MGSWCGWRCIPKPHAYLIDVWCSVKGFPFLIWLAWWVCDRRKSHCVLSVRKALRVAETGSLITTRWLQLHISKLQPGGEAEHVFAIGTCTITCVQNTLPAPQINAGRNTCLMSRVSLELGCLPKESLGHVYSRSSWIKTNLINTIHTTSFRDKILSHDLPQVIEDGEVHEVSSKRNLQRKQ